MKGLKRGSLAEVVAEIMRDQRQAKGLSQDELARLVGSTRQSISQYENGHFLPHVGLMLRIASALDISLDHLRDVYG